MYALALLVAGASFSDDFESGQLYVGNGGKWDTVATFSTDVTMRLTADGAHRGLAGVHIVDMDGRTDAGNGEQAWLVQPVSGFGSALWFRYWVRQSFSGTGLVEIDYLHLNPDGGSFGSAGTVFRVPSGRLQIGGYDAPARFLLTPIDAGLVNGQWHLVELGVTGIGTTDGGRNLWLDGQRVGGVSGVDFSGFDTVSISMGENFSSPLSPTGVLDFDDVVASSAPNATFIALTAPPQAGARACTEVEVALTSVTGGPAAAPYDVVATVLGAGVSHFSDAACTVPAAGVTVPQGEDRAKGWLVIPEAGDFTLSALHPDLLSRPGVRLRAGEGKLGVGCGCGAGRAPWPVLLLLRARSRSRSRLRP